MTEIRNEAPSKMAEQLQTLQTEEANGTSTNDGGEPTETFSPETTINEPSTGANNTGNMGTGSTSQETVQDASVEVFKYSDKEMKDFFKDYNSGKTRIKFLPEKVSFPEVSTWEELQTAIEAVEAKYTIEVGKVYISRAQAEAIMGM